MTSDDGAHLPPCAFLDDVLLFVSIAGVPIWVIRASQEGILLTQDIITGEICNEYWPLRPQAEYERPATC